MGWVLTDVMTEDDRMSRPTDNELRQEIASLRAAIAANWLANRKHRAILLNDRLLKIEREAAQRPSMAHEFGGHDYAPAF